jgi:hypothetical protein
MGPNTTGVNGLALKKGETQILRHGDRLEVLLGKYVYRVEFEPPPPVEEIKTEGDERKRKRDEVNSVIKKVCSESLSKAVGEPSPESKWEAIDNGKLLIYTAKNVVAQPKVKKTIILFLVVCSVMKTYALVLYLFSFLSIPVCFLLIPPHLLCQDKKYVSQRPRKWNLQNSKAIASDI